MPYKTFTAGVLTSSDVNTYLMKQAVMTFASTTARDSALGSILAAGLLTFQSDTNTFTYYNGSSWLQLGSAAGAGSDVAFFMGS